LSPGVVPIAGAVLVVVLAAALVAGSLLAVASVGVVAGLVALVAVLGVERVDARLNAYEGFTRPWRGVVFTTIAGVAAFGPIYGRESVPPWRIVVPLIWGTAVAVNGASFGASLSNARTNEARGVRSNRDVPFRSRQRRRHPSDPPSASEQPSHAGRLGQAHRPNGLRHDAARECIGSSCWELCALCDHGGERRVVW
jgi:hypothetical protein